MNNPDHAPDNDVRARLNRLRSLGSLRTPTVETPFRLPGTPQPLEALTTGYLHETELGASYIIPTLHAADHVHGGRALSEWLSQNLAGAAAFTRDARLAKIDPRRCLFLDTETTGLAGGAGTLVFLVGIGLFTERGFEVRQFFLRDPAEEPAMLHAIHSLLKAHEVLVTFNGRSFDVPLLASRFTMNRQRVRFDAWVNLDLLHPARRLWKRRLESCRLAALEADILGVERTGADVPGYLIPQMYQDYVRTGDGRDMLRVIYHNLIDVLSMVTLAAHLCEIFAQPEAMRLPSDDLLSLAQWYEGLDLPERAEATYVAALTAARRDAEMAQVLESLAGLLKRQDRRAEAAAHWETWAALMPKADTPRLELAMYHEWHTGDLAKARAWTEDALRVVRGWGYSERRESTAADLQHRLERLDRKR